MSKSRQSGPCLTHFELFAWGRLLGVHVLLHTRIRSVEINVIVVIVTARRRSDGN